MNVPRWFSAMMALILTGFGMSLGCLAASAADVEYIMDPRAKPAIAKAVQLIKAGIAGQQAGYRSLAAYALVKAGEPVTSPLVTDAIKIVAGKVKSDGYHPLDHHYQIYEAGMDLMLLCDTTPGDYKGHIESIVQFILKDQKPGGYWTYPGDAESDTSITQYAMLGLWAAERTGRPIPMAVWAKCAKWLIGTQQADGGFTYHPGTTVGFDGGRSTPSMTNAALGCILVARIYLYPEQPYFGTTSGPKQKKFGLLDDVKASKFLEDVQKRRQEAGDVPSLAAIDQCANRGIAWISSHWTTRSSNAFTSYFYYTMERAGALVANEKIGGHEWFNECLPVVLKSQKEDGAFDDQTTKEAAAALNVLFMTRTTGRIIEKMNIAGGLQTGGRGLPDDLAAASSRKGKITERKPKGALDEMLSDLATADATALEDTQTAIVEKVQIGDRNELLNQMETVRKLATHPNVEVRKTAVWALGRSGKITDAMYLIRALNDDDVDVLVEANAALKYLSRKLAGVGVPESPYVDLPENATDAQKIAAIASWRREALTRWTAWYTRVRPFNERNDLFEFLNRTSE